MEDTEDDAEAIQQAVDMIVKFCADRGIGLQATMAFTVGEESFVEHFCTEGEEILT